MTTLQPQPTRWKWYWLHLGLLRSHAEMLANYDYVGSTWQERPTVKAKSCGKAHGYCAACARQAEEER